jgi:hypothetical protein
MLRFVGFGLFAAAAACGVVAWFLDRRLRAFRLPDEPTSSYLLVPLRIRRDLYRSEAGPLVDRTWRVMATMYGLALLGMVLIAFRS